MQCKEDDPGPCCCIDSTYSHSEKLPPSGENTELWVKVKSMCEPDWSCFSQSSRVRTLLGHKSSASVYEQMQCRSKLLSLLWPSSPNWTPIGKHGDLLTGRETQFKKWSQQSMETRKADSDFGIRVSLTYRHSSLLQTSILKCINLPRKATWNTGNKHQEELSMFSHYHRKEG